MSATAAAPEPMVQHTIFPGTETPATLPPLPGASPGTGTQ
jgi:hypothetical protein